MLRTTQRTANTLFTAVALYYASTVSSTTAACVSFSASSTAGTPEDVSIATPTSFACADGSFLTAAEASYVSSTSSKIGSLSWTCSDREEIGSFSSDNSGDAAVSFTVGITGVHTGVEDGSLPFLAGMYIGGYDVDSGNADGTSFSWKGPFGAFDDDEEVLPSISASYCDSGAFATGVTVWASSSFVYGVRLECAAVADTCSPPGYPASLVEDLPDSSTGGSGSDSTSLVAIISASVGGGLLLIVMIAVGVWCCIRCRRRRESEARHHEKTGQTTAAVAVAVPTAAAGKRGVPPAPDRPPPPYVEPSSYFEPPPPAYA